MSEDTISACGRGQNKHLGGVLRVIVPQPISNYVPDGTLVSNHGPSTQSEQCRI